MRVTTIATAVGLSLCLPLGLFLCASSPRQAEPPRLENRPAARRPSMELMDRAVKIQSRVRRLPVWRASPPLSIRSPDGRWRLWADEQERVARASKGSRVIRRRTKTKAWIFASDTIWLPGSRRWVGLVAGDSGLCARVEGLDKPGTIREVLIGYPRSTVSWPDLIPSKLLGLVGSRLLAKPVFVGERSRMPFYSFSIAGGSPNVRNFTIALPRGARDGDEVALSPRGDHLAWLLYFQRSTRPDEPIKEVRLMLSRPDGSRMCTLARLRLDPVVPANSLFSKSDDLPREIRWLPDSHSVSFVYQNARWKIAVA